MELSRPRDNRPAISPDHRRDASPGPWILVPGYPQWLWRQNERAFVLFGSYLAAVGVGVFTWGSLISLVVLVFAFLTHAFSAADAIRQYAFPGFGKMVPAISASAGLGTVCYAPVLAVASIYAWPIVLDERPREGYLINRRAYAEVGPKTGETVWLRASRGVRPRVARVVAGPRQRIEWSGGEFRVDDQIIEDSPFRPDGSPGELKLTVPEGHVLVVFGADPTRNKGVPGGWEIVGESDIRGRAWARSYPIWDRQFLP